MKTLVAIINEPAESIHFIRYVAGMAKDLRMGVHLLYPKSTSTYPLGSTGAIGATAPQMQGNLEGVLESARETLKQNMDHINNEFSEKIIIDITSKMGSSLALVKKMLEEKKIEMVVLEGRTGENFWNPSPGSTEIAEGVDCPVWIIPKDSVYHSFKKIVYATDYQEEDIRNLKRLIALVHVYSPEITALHVTDSTDFEDKVKKTGFSEMLREKIAYQNIRLKVQKKKDKESTADMINSFALSNMANLLVILKENKSFLEMLFTSDITDQIVKDSSLPILIFHEKK